MKVAICDDELSHCGTLEKYLLKLSEKYINLTVDIDVYQSGEEMLRVGLVWAHFTIMTRLA